MAAYERPGVYIRGLSDLRRVLRRANRQLDKGVAATMRTAGKLVRGRAREFAPVGPARDPHRGSLKASLRYSVTTRRASIYSRDPKAGVHEWGGTIHPRGAPVAIPRRYYMHKAVRNSRREVDALMVGILDAIARTWQSGA